jgi:DNA-binding Xre family transcriptional regulator
MLSFNPKRVFALRSIENPAQFMVEAGIGRKTANNLLQQQTSVVKIEHLERLCRLLNCTPNDFFEWHGDSALSEKHSLNTLQRNRTAKSIQSKIHQIPLEEVEKLLEKEQL